MLAGSPMAAPPRAGAAPTLESTLSGLEGVGVFNAQFESTRTLKVLRRPLLSGGSLLLAKEHGLIWTQTFPFRQKLTIMAEVMRQEIQGGETIEISAKDNPLVFVISRVFIAMFSGDRETLNRHFSMSFQSLPFKSLEGDGSKGQGWEWSLEPITSPINRAIARIRIQGRETISALDILATNGDRTRIALTHVRARSEPLTPSEVQAFRP